MQRRNWRSGSRGRARRARGRAPIPRPEDPEAPRRGRVLPVSRPSFLLGHFSERSIAREDLDVFAHRRALGLEIVLDGARKALIGEPVQRMGFYGQVAAGDLVLALGTGLDRIQPVGDGVVDGLVIAGLEMQAGVMLDRAPIA